MTSKVFGFAVPSSFFDTTNVQIQGEKGAQVSYYFIHTTFYISLFQIGIRLTNAMVVTEVNLHSISHMRLMIGDVILSVNGNKMENRAQFTELYSKINHSAPTFSIDVVLMRPVVSMPVGIYNQLYIA